MNKKKIFIVVLIVINIIAITIALRSVFISIQNQLNRNNYGNITENINY